MLPWRKAIQIEHNGGPVWGSWPIPSCTKFALLERGWGYQEGMPCDHLERSQFSIEPVVYRSVLPSLLFVSIQVDGKI